MLWNYSIKSWWNFSKLILIWECFSILILTMKFKQIGQNIWCSRTDNLSKVILWKTILYLNKSAYSHFSNFVRHWWSKFCLECISSIIYESDFLFQFVKTSFFICISGIYFERFNFYFYVFFTNFRNYSLNPNCYWKNRKSNWYS